MNTKIGHFYRATPMAKNTLINMFKNIYMLTCIFINISIITARAALLPQ